MKPFSNNILRAIDALREASHDPSDHDIAEALETAARLLDSPSIDTCPQGWEEWSLEKRELVVCLLGWFQQGIKLPQFMTEEVKQRQIEMAQLARIIEGTLKPNTPR